tara:strand:- start:1515 stop:1877 length:363 start_codon:yes stop_codon:yes gene_type:complete
MDYEIEIKHKVNPEVFSDLFITVLESGYTSAWLDDINSDKPLTEKETWEKLKEFKFIITHDGRDETDSVTVNHETVLTALAKTVDTRNLKFDSDNLLEDFDALDADLFFQYLCFGDLVYG